MHTVLASSLLIALAGTAASAQTSPARGPTPNPMVASADIPLEDYLGLLEQIAPPARAGAEAYLDAIRLRCGRSLTAYELRRAIAEQDGDPVLMQMIRASSLEDAEGLARLATQVPCTSDARP